MTKQDFIATLEDYDVLTIGETETPQGTIGLYWIVDKKEPVRNEVAFTGQRFDWTDYFMVFQNGKRMQFIEISEEENAFIDETLKVAGVTK